MTSWRCYTGRRRTLGKLPAFLHQRHSENKLGRQYHPFAENSKQKKQLRESIIIDYIDDHWLIVDESSSSRMAIDPVGADREFDADWRVTVCALAHPDQWRRMRTANAGSVSSRAEVTSGAEARPECCFSSLPNRSLDRMQVASPLGRCRPENDSSLPKGKS